MIAVVRCMSLMNVWDPRTLTTLSHTLSTTSNVKRCHHGLKEYIYSWTMRGLPTKSVQMGAAIATVQQSLLDFFVYALWLSGIRSLHDIFIVKNPATGYSLMKVQRYCYEGIFKNSPMKKISDDCVLPMPCHSFKYLNKVRVLSEAKMKDLCHMYKLYVPPDMSPDFIS